jgi:hypothetical protein
LAGADEALAGEWGASAGEERGHVGALGKGLGDGGPALGDDGGDAVSLAGVFDGGDEEVCEGEVAEAFAEGDPCGDGAGDGDAVHPRMGMRERPSKRWGVHAAGARPEAFSPWSAAPSQIWAKASLPMPFMVGSTTVSVMAAAMAASTALPPRRRMRRPAWAARGWEVATVLGAMTADRREG